MARPQVAPSKTLDLTPEEQQVLHSILRQVSPQEATGKIVVGTIQAKLEAVIQSRDTPPKE